MRRKVKDKFHKCRSTDLRYSSGPLLKTNVKCGSCGATWSCGRTNKARERYAREVYPE